MSIYKRIISLCIVFAMCISLMVVPASATGLIPAGEYAVTNFTKYVALGALASESFDYLRNGGEYFEAYWDAMNTGVCDGCEVSPDQKHDFRPSDGLVVIWEAALKGGEACDCRYCGITFDEFCNSSYNQYVSSLQSDLGTTVLSNGAVRKYFAFSSKFITLGYLSTPDAEWSNTSTSIIVRTLYEFDDPVACPAYFYFMADKGSKGRVTLTAPFNGTAVYGCNFICPTASSYVFDYDGSSIGVSAGSSYVAKDMTVNLTGLDEDSWHYIEYSQWMDFTPLGGLSSLTNLDVSETSRSASIIGDYGIIGDDGTIIKVDGNMIVDESTNIVYNPVTNNTYNYIDYAFDYSDRSYNLTLEDGSSIKVVYGDENITIHEGDTVYNVYYIIENGSGESGGESGGEDVPDSGTWSWWKEAWQTFTDKLFSVIGGGSSSVNPEDMPSAPDDETTPEDEKWSFIELLVVLKDGTWKVITGIVSTAYDGFAGFVATVTDAGNFFDSYDMESEESIFFIPVEEGANVWA